MNNSFIKTYTDIPLNLKEIYRYAGCKTPTPDIFALIDEALNSIKGKITYKISYRIFPIVQTEDKLDLGFAETDSQDLRKNLSGCTEIVLFGATIGLGVEKHLNKTALLSPSKSLILQSIGDERVESLCDFFNEEVREHYKRENRATKPRFSPGYGDLSLNIQKDIFNALSLTETIGISLGKNLFMTPSKSVTAIIGITAPKG